MSDNWGNSNFYYESTWTPTIGDGTNNFTLTLSSGYYIVCGSLLNYWTRIQWTGKGSAVAGSNVKVGLPVVMITGGNYKTSSCIGYARGITYTNTLAASDVEPPAQALYIYDLDPAGGTPSIIKVSDCSTTGLIHFAGSYQINP